MEKEQYWDVIQILESVVPRLTGKLRQRGRMALGRAYLKNPNWVKQGEEEIRAVVTEDPKHVEAYILLAQVYKDRGLTTRAMSMFRKVRTRSMSLSTSFRPPKANFPPELRRLKNSRLSVGIPSCSIPKDGPATRSRSRPASSCQPDGNTAPPLKAVVPVTRSNSLPFRSPRW